MIFPWDKKKTDHRPAKTLNCSLANSSTLTFGTSVIDTISFAESQRREDGLRAAAKKAVEDTFNPLYCSCKAPTLVDRMIRIGEEYRYCTTCKKEKI